MRSEYSAIKAKSGSLRVGLRQRALGTRGFGVSGEIHYLEITGFGISGEIRYLEITGFGVSGEIHLPKFCFGISGEIHYRNF